MNIDPRMWFGFLAGLLLTTGVLTAVLFVRMNGYIRRLRTKTQEQSKQIDDLTQRMDIFNGAAKRVKKHNGYNENKALEDVVSLLVQDEIEDKMETSAKRARRETAVAILWALRYDPKSYDPDKSLEDYLKERKNL